MRRTLVALGATLSVLTAGAPAVLAQPSNDDFGAATVISALPFTDRVNTVDATIAADDPSCAGTGATVWYKYTPAANAAVDVNTFGSDYDTTLSLYTGSRGALYQVFCNDDAGGVLQSQLEFRVWVGVTYYLMVGSLGSEPGGNLVFSISEFTPVPPEITLTVAGGSVNAKTGVATVRGTVTCNGHGDTAIVFGWLKQTVARRTIEVPFFGGVFRPCSGQVSWSADVYPHQLGPFVGGPAVALAVTDYWHDQFGSDHESTTVTLHLTGTRQTP